MKAINIKSVIDVFNNLTVDSISSYLKFFGLKLAMKGDNEGIKAHEILSLKSFEARLNDTIKRGFEDKSVNLLDSYFWGYKIPQIGKEFDLLRFGEVTIINIELKSESTKEKVKKQLIQNRYYLGFLQKEVFLFTYVVNDNKLYQLQTDSNKEELVETDFLSLCEILHNQNIQKIQDIDTLFNPSNYLVSPFNSTEQFIHAAYFLTGQQEEIKKDVLKLINKNTVVFISITGSAGTGKTLLTYDIARTLIADDFKILILHTAQLNNGQNILKADYGWNIFSTRYGLTQDFCYYNAVFIDEAQRLSISQFDTVVQKIKEANVACVFSYDHKQCLRNLEINNNIPQRINTLLSVPEFKLTEKIRTNKEIASFIKQLLNKKYDIIGQKYKNIELCYFLDRSEVKLFLTYLHNNGWKVPQYTPGTKTYFHYENYIVDGEDSAHSVIGQEFDDTVAVIDDYFYYTDEGHLSVNRYNEVYSQRQMLYQILTRTRKKLFIVIINNEKVLKRCLKILGQ